MKKRKCFSPTFPIMKGYRHNFNAFLCKLIHTFFEIYRIIKEGYNCISTFFSAFDPKSAETIVLYKKCIIMTLTSLILSQPHVRIHRNIIYKNNKSTENMSKADQTSDNLHNLWAVYFGQSLSIFHKNC